MKYVVIVILCILGLGILFVWLGNSTSGAMTEPIRTEFASRTARGVRDTFRITKTTYGEKTGEAIVEITHESGVKETRIFHLAKNGEVWGIANDEPYVEPVVAQVQTPKLISVEYYGADKKDKPVGADGYPEYSFYFFDQTTKFVFDKPITQPIDIKFERRHIGVYGSSKTTITIKPENPPTNIVWKDGGYVDAFAEKRAGNLGQYEDTYTIGDQVITQRFSIR